MEKPSLNSIYLAVAAMVFLGSAAPAFAQGINCTFKVTGDLSLNFPALDPSTGGAKYGSVLAGAVGTDQIGQCNFDMIIAVDTTSSPNFSGTPRLKNLASNDYIPYSFDYFPLPISNPGNKNWVTLKVTATILESAYLDAPGGAYSDQIRLVVTP